MTTSSVPEELKGDDLPDLLVLTIDAASILLLHHAGLFKRWGQKKMVNRIFIDEAQQYYGEIDLRSPMSSLRHIGRYGIVVVVLSGTLSQDLVPPLMNYYGLGESQEIYRSVGLDQSPIQALPHITHLECLTNKELLDKACYFAQKRVADNKGDVQIVCASKSQAKEIHQRLGKDSTALLVTGDTPAADMEQSSKEWYDGKASFLVTTTCGTLPSKTNCALQWLW